MCQSPNAAPNNESDEGKTQEEQPKPNKLEVPHGAPMSNEGFNKKQNPITSDNERSTFEE
jgi:hypothetical protein